MAEEKATQTDTAVVPAKPSLQKPIILIGLVVVNMLVVIVVGFMLWKGRKIEESRPSVDQVVEGELKTQSQEAT
ncbi:MAG: hypothetical protein AB7F43_15495 [Bacteriovoracia bacterium]